MSAKERKRIQAELAQLELDEEQLAIKSKRLELQQQLARLEDAPSGFVDLTVDEDEDEVKQEPIDLTIDDTKVEVQAEPKDEAGCAREASGSKSPFREARKDNEANTGKTVESEDGRKEP